MSKLFVGRKVTEVPTSVEKNVEQRGRVGSAGWGRESCNYKLNEIKDKDKLRRIKARNKSPIRSV